MFIKCYFSPRFFFLRSSFQLPMTLCHGSFSLYHSIILYDCIIFFLSSYDSLWSYIFLSFSDFLLDCEICFLSFWFDMIDRFFFRSSVIWCDWENFLSISLFNHSDGLTQLSIKDKQLPGRYRHDPGILW